MNNGEYLSKVASRALTPGMLVLIVGAVAAYASGRLAGLIEADRSGQRFQKINLVIKCIGCAVALVGAVLIFTA